MSEQFEGNVAFVKIDVDENAGVRERFGVRGIPTLILLRGGKELIEAAWSSAPDASFSLGDEWDRLLALAAPAGEAVPAALAAFSHGDDLGVQLLLKVAPGFTERLAAAAAGPKPPPYRVKLHEAELELSFGEEVILARVDDAGWLRIAPDREQLVGAAPGGPTLDLALAGRIAENDGALFVVGGGKLMALVASTLFDDSPEVAQIVAGLRSLSMTWRSDGDRSYVAQVAIDLPMFALFGPTVRKPGLQNALARRWDDQATGLISASIPEGARKAMLPLLDNLLAGSPFALPEGLKATLSKLEGRIGSVTFGSPDDWAVGIEMLDAAAAEAAVPAVHGWLQGLAAQHAPSAADVLALEQATGSQPELHIRPDEVLQGPRVAAVGSTLVVVRQRQRLETLTAAVRKGGSSVVAGPLTPPVKALLEEPALLLGYWVFGTDPGLFDWMAWLAKGGEVALKLLLADGPEELAMAQGVVHRLAPSMALAGYLSLLTYDAAFALDVEGSVLTLDLAGSDL